MKLLGSLTSPYARKVRILLAEKGIACDFQEAVPNAQDSPIPALNPLGKVPVLVRDDGSVLFDSPLILEWLDRSKPPPLIPADGEERWQVLLWQALADGMMDASVLLMMETRRAPEHQSKTALAHQAGKVASAMEYANARIRGDTLVGASFSLADIALGSALEYVDLRNPHAWREQHPALAGWHAKLAERSSFSATRPPGLVAAV
ncbi:MAG: glutathione S-transferase N-terminal domain-containing protein [Myxococcales bacterium]|nr:glutathione S-transferase N-terminal domain-containing protein [Myxococcales bacterium]